MHINLLPWRERKKQKNNRLLLQYSFVSIVFTFFVFMGVRYGFLLELEDMKNKNSILRSRLLRSQLDANKRSKTAWIVNLLSGFPVFIQDGMYINKILIDENLITLNVSVSEISKFEKFIQKVKKQRGIKKTSINGSMMHGSADSENKENKFMVNFYPDSSENILE